MSSFDVEVEDQNDITGEHKDSIGDFNQKKRSWQTLANLLLVRQVSFAGHRSQVIVLPIQKVSQTPLKANLRPN